SGAACNSNASSNSRTGAATAAGAGSSADRQVGAATRIATDDNYRAGNDRANCDGRTDNDHHEQSPCSTTERRPNEFVAGDHLDHRRHRCSHRALPRLGLKKL
ncbi:MAG TPA: hypothetical protein VGA10_06805, partial [Thermoanaerobaculia bacterium]